MGLARGNPGGQTRLGLSATAGSAVLYGAIVVFGIGSATPSALDVGGDRHGSVVLVPGHADIVPGSVKKLPQASPEPGRHRSHTRARQRGIGVAPAETSSAPSTIAAPTPKSPESPRVTESESPSAASSTPASVSDPPLVVTVPVLPVPAVTVPLPELPVPVPELPAPQPPLTLPLSLP